MIFYQEIVFCRQLTDFCACKHNKSLAIDQTFACGVQRTRTAHLDTASVALQPDELIPLCFGKCRRFLSGQRDSNSRPPAPKAGILTGLNYIPFVRFINASTQQFRRLHTLFRTKPTAKIQHFFQLCKFFRQKMQNIFILPHIAMFACYF